KPAGEDRAACAMYPAAYRLTAIRLWTYVAKRRGWVMSLASRDVRKLLDCLAHLYAPPSGSFAVHVLGAARDLVSADTRVWNRFDLPRRRLTYAEDPPGKLGTDKRIAEMVRRLFPEHPLLAYNISTRGRSRATAISDLLGVRAFHRSSVYAEFFRPAQIQDQVAVAVPGSFPRLSGLIFHRSTRSFTQRDRLMLDLLAPHLARAERSAAALDRARSLSRGLEAALAMHGTGVLVLG